jgi:hypothetical protein
LKVLPDEDLPHRLRIHLHGHEVSTVRFPGWDGLKNGLLTRTAEDAGFDVFLTGDQNLTSQQNWTGRRLSVITLTAQRLEILLLHIPAIRAAIDAATSGSQQTVHCPEAG